MTLVVACVDGGLPDIVSTWDFFSPHRRLPGVPDSGALRLRTIFPSSTAPAHAAFLTGAHAASHGIVGNRFWTGEPVRCIRGRADDPVLSLHPYESHSLTAPSLLDWLTDRGARIAALQFPHTFSRAGARPAVPSLYCLYAPAREIDVRLDREEPAALSYFGESVPLHAKPMASGTQLILGSTANRSVVVGAGETVRLEHEIAPGSLSLAVRCSEGVDGRVTLRIGTAVLSLRFGWPAIAGAPTAGPSSLTPDYSANPEHVFHESPRADWVADAAVAALTALRPDVLFVRFNQVDHAQEFLYWHATRADGAERALARQQILDTYQVIDTCLGRIMAEAGPDADYVLFSDHGIDFVERHIRPNVVLQELGLELDMVFQGDSNIAYLYTDRPVSAADRTRIEHTLIRADATTLPLNAVTAAALRLPWGSARLGRLAVTCGPHREFVYGATGSTTEQVRSASHGYLPAHPRMHGFFRMFGPGTTRIGTPADLVGAANVVKRLWSRRVR